MGNLLSEPITTKETHRGTLVSSSSSNNKDDDNTIQWAVSSMQGWRVHMEDAHVAEGSVYAVDPNSSSSRINLPHHAIFGVLDGHGGTYAPLYAGANFCRVLSHQQAFYEYAQKVTSPNFPSLQEWEARYEKEKEDNNNNNNNNSIPPRTKYQYLYQESGLGLLKQALKDAFVELDQELALSMIQGTPVPLANTPYHDPSPAQEQQDNKDEANSSPKEEEEEADKASTPAATTSPNDASSSSSTSPPTTVHNDPYRADDNNGDSGTTICIVVVTPDWIVCANAGDSRAVLVSPIHNNDAASVGVLPLSHDHKPDDDLEQTRIRHAGGYVAAGRVQGDLAVSRGLGDYRFKDLATVLAGKDAAEQRKREQQGGGNDNNNDNNSEAVPMDEDPPAPTQQQKLVLLPGEQQVSPIPDVIYHARSATDDAFVLIACDGIWDVLNNAGAVRVLTQMTVDEGETDVGLAMEELLDICLALDSKDNMTALMIQFPAGKASTSGGGGVQARRNRRKEDPSLTASDCAKVAPSWRSGSG